MLTIVATQLIKYIFEGLAIAIAVYVIPKRKISYQEIALISVIAGSIFAVLDYFSPFIGFSGRQGSGFGIGYNLATNIEGFKNDYNDNDIKQLLEECDTVSELAVEDLDNITDNVETITQEQMYQ
jgi:hypothetical protein